MTLYWALGQVCYWTMFTFWMSTSAMIWSRRINRDRPRKGLLWTFRITRKLAWWACAGRIAFELLDAKTFDDVPIFGLVLSIVLTWWNMSQSKDLDDDDDWTKRLVEWGQGVVERVGNRLAVVVPAPAGA